MRSIKLNSTGETIDFVKTGRETQGAYAEIICTVPARQKGPPLHIHPLQDESFEVIAGRIELLVAGEKKLLDQGQHFVAAAGSSHSFSNPCDSEIKFKATYRPALNIDYFLVQSFERLNIHPDIKRPGFQLMVDFDYILKQIHGQFAFTRLPSLLLTIGSFFGNFFLKPGAKSLEEHNASF
ncbi:MAG: cupin domain-containing protein [Chitinophagales bacterium]